MIIRKRALSREINTDIVKKKKKQQIKTYVTATNVDSERFNIQKDGRDVRRDDRSCCGFFLFVPLVLVLNYFKPLVVNLTLKE